MVEGSELLMAGYVNYMRASAALRHRPVHAPHPAMPPLIDPAMNPQHGKPPKQGRPAPVQPPHMAPGEEFRGHLFDPAMGGRRATGGGR